MVLQPSRQANSLIRRTRRVVLIVAAIALMTACGDGSSSSSDDSGSTNSLSLAAQRGREVADQAGCAACHGTNWGGGVAPTWIGLSGAQVSLDDGTTVVADAAYLERAITAPAEQRVRGFSIVMPPNALTAAQVADVVAFIQALSADG